MTRPLQHALLLTFAALILQTGPVVSEPPADPATSLINPEPSPAAPASSHIGGSEWSAEVYSLEAADPSFRQRYIQPADPSRLVTVDNPVYEPDPELDLRTAVPCTNIAYHNGPSFQISYYIFGGDAPRDNVADDLTLPPGSPNSFICAAKVVTRGFRLSGPPTYDLQVQL